MNTLFLLAVPGDAEKANPVMIGALAWVVFMIIAFLWLKKNKMTQKRATFLLIVSFIVGGLMFGARPSAIMPFHEIVLGLTNTELAMKARIQSIMGVTIILTSLLVSGYFIGRLFCGYACPLGAIQELISKLKFKTSKIPTKLTPKKADTRRKTSDVIRWVMFVAYMVGTAIIGAGFAQMANPFVGLTAISTKNISMLIIPFILLVIVLISSIFIYRPYCRYFCPYGALAAVVNKGDQSTIRFGDGCKDCDLCSHVCPTDSMHEGSDKSECYYCGRCVNVCTDNNCKADINLLDNKKVADINNHLTAATLLPDQIDKVEFVDKAIKLLIASFPNPGKKMYLKELQTALKENEKHPMKHIQPIIEKIQIIAPKELSEVNFESYNSWIDENMQEWADQFNTSVKVVDVDDKIFYGAGKKVKKNKKSKGEMN